MNITIAPATPAPGYCVTAELPSGLAHDYFPTREAALAFATTFYGGTVQPTPPAARDIQSAWMAATQADLAECHAELERLYARKAAVVACPRTCEAIEVQIYPLSRRAARLERELAGQMVANHPSISLQQAVELVRHLADTTGKPLPAPRPATPAQILQVLKANPNGLNGATLFEMFPEDEQAFFDKLFRMQQDGLIHGWAWGYRRSLTGRLGTIYRCDDVQFKADLPAQKVGD